MARALPSLHVFSYLPTWPHQVLVADVGSHVTEHGSAAVSRKTFSRGIWGSWFPIQGSNPSPPALEGGFFTTGPSGEPPAPHLYLLPYLGFKHDVSFSNPQLPNAPSSPPDEGLEICLRETPGNQQVDRLSLRKLRTMVDQG